MIFNPVTYGQKLPELSSPAESGDILQGKQAIGEDGNIISGSIPSLWEKYYTPGQRTIIIEAGQFLEGRQAIYGEPSLKSENIKQGISIFGVLGTLSPGFGRHTTFMTTGATNTITFSNVTQKPTWFAIWIDVAASGGSGSNDALCSLCGEWETSSWVYALSYSGSIMGVRANFSYSGTTARITLPDHVFRSNQMFECIMI